MRRGRPAPRKIGRTVGDDLADALRRAVALGNRQEIDAARARCVGAGMDVRSLDRIIDGRE